MRRFLRRLAYLFRRSAIDAQIREEMDFHRAMLARRGAEGGFGNATLAREDARAVWIAPWFESVGQDIRYGVRSLRHARSFTLTALGALGVAIGLNTSLFTTFNAVMLRRWPVPDAGRMVTVSGSPQRPAISIAEYSFLASSSRTFEGLFITRCLDGVISGCTLHVDDDPLEAEFVSGNYFDVLRLAPRFGDGLHTSGAPTGSAVAVISDAVWRTRFSADPGVAGRIIRLDDVPFTIGGVAPPGFMGTLVSRTDVWIPLAASASLRPDHIFDDGKREGLVSGRLAAGALRAQAEAELSALRGSFHAGERDPRPPVQLVDATGFPGAGRRTIAVSLFALMQLATVLVLLLACANVGNLLLARAAARRREIAIRLAIGAGRARILRQLLTECGLLSAFAAAIGLTIAYELPRAIVARIAGPLAFRLEPDTSVLAYAVGMSVLACAAFGLAPAWHATGARSRLLSCGGPAAPQLRIAGLPLRSILLATQVGIAVVLLIGAGLLVRGVRTATSADPGFDMRDVSVITLTLPASYETPRVRAFARQVLDRVTPAVMGPAMGFADTEPFGAEGRLWLTVTGPDGRSEDVLVVDASAGYFATLGIPILLGRGFEPVDTTDGGVLVNETMAHEFWPLAPALGQRLTADGPRHIVGIVKDVRHYPFAVRTTFPTIYLPIDGRTVPRILARHLPAASAQAIAVMAREIEPRARVTIEPLDARLTARLAQSRVSAMLAGAVGILGVILAALGVFSVFAYSVEQRTPDIGIRMALGARPAHVLRTVLAGGGGPLAAGLAAGLAVSLPAARLLQRFLYGLSPFDPLTYAAVAAVLSIAAAAAVVFPARTAARVDPVVALKGCE